MKRKKTPVAAITALVLAFVGLLIASKNFAFYSKSGEEQMQEMQEKIQKEQQAKSAQGAKQEVDATKETQSLKTRMAAANAGAKKFDQPEDDSRPKEPSVLMPEDKVYVPVKNEAATSSQWYK